MRVFLPSLVVFAFARDSRFPEGLKSKVTLNNGVKMPVFGLGTWQSDPGVVKNAVKYALRDANYIHIDTAWFYENQPEVGEGIRELIEEGKITREQVFVTSKIWMTFYDEGKVMSNAKETLEQLGLDYVDQMLLHWPVALELEYDEVGKVVRLPKDSEGNIKTVERDMQEVWLELEKVYKSGLAKSIGVSNFEPETIDRLLNPAQWEGGLCTACTVVPAVNQVELHPSWPQRRLSRYCHSRGIRMVAYAPLANPSMQQDGVVHPNPMENPVVLEVAKRHGKTGAQVLLRWSLQRGNIVIPKSTKESRIKENSEVFDFTLNEEEMRTINSLSLDASRRTRVFNPPLGPKGSKSFFGADRDFNLSDAADDTINTIHTEL